MAQPGSRTSTFSVLIRQAEECKQLVTSLSSNASQDQDSVLRTLELYHFHTNKILMGLGILRAWQDTSESATEACRKAKEVDEMVASQIIKLHNQLHPESLMTSDSFYRPGSPEWHSSFLFTRLNCHASSNIKSEELGAECFICLDPYELGQRVIQLPCHATHMIHADCLKVSPLLTFSPVVLC